MAGRAPKKPPEETPTGFPIPGRNRKSVLRDFEKVAGPLRGQNRDRKPKA
jgi:hypothetical protein